MTNKASLKTFLARKELGIFGLLVLLCLMTSAQNPNFLRPENLQNMARLTGIYGIFSLGLAFVVITGGIDLSVGSVFALLGVAIAMLLERGTPPVIAVLITVGLGAAIGVLHGILVTKVKLQPFLVTLCGLLVYRGIARTVANDETKGFGMAKGFEWLPPIANSNTLGIPNTFWLLILVAAILWVVLHRSVFGRHLIAVGRSEDAARYAGINANSVIMKAYIICGVLTGLASILLAFFTNTVGPATHGNSYELYGIAAAVLGGCSLRGGEGSVVGVVLGATLLRVLQNLVTLLHIPSSLEFAVTGAVIMAGVLTDEILRRRRKA